MSPFVNEEDKRVLLTHQAVPLQGSKLQAQYQIQFDQAKDKSKEPASAQPILQTPMLARGLSNQDSMKNLLGVFKGFEE